MVVQKRCLLWDWTNTDGPGHKGVPQEMDKVNFGGPMHSVSNVRSNFSRTTLREDAN